MRVMTARGEWTGRRLGVKIHLRYAGGIVKGSHPSPIIVHWRARIGGEWTDGEAGTVFDAIQEIERRAAV
jgi:hypothetical protein